MSFRKIAKTFIRKLGYKVIKLRNHPLFDSEEPFSGIKSMMNENDCQGFFFDVGANIGQTIDELNSYFPNGIIYAFEPGTSFSILRNKYQRQVNLTLENLALGATNESRTFYVNSLSDMSSFLPLGQEGWGEIETEPIVQVKTLDSYCEEKNIPFINILKCDTQGFELEVLKGAKNMLPKTEFILLEINFREIYKDLPSFSDIYNLLSKYGFKLVRFYRQQYKINVLSHADVLFYNPDF